jgi:hypothetical protein
MLGDPRTNDLRHRVRCWLGVTDLHHQLQRIEATMANEILNLVQGLVAQTTDLTATQQAAFTNIHNGQQRLDSKIGELKQQLADALAGDGKVTPEIQAAVDQIAQAYADLKQGATVASQGFDEDHSADEDQPVVPPADGGDTPTDPTGDVPTDPEQPGDGTEPLSSKRR